MGYQINFEKITNNLWSDIMEETFLEIRKFFGFLDEEKFYAFINQDKINSYLPKDCPMCKRKISINTDFGINT